MRNSLLLLFCTAVFLFQSCQNYEDFRAIDSVDHSPEFAVPLINTSLSIDDILDEVEDISYLTVDPDGSMTLNYSNDQIQKGASELSQELDDFPIVLVDSTMNMPAQFFDNLAVNSLYLKNGTIDFEVQSSHTEDINLNIIFPGLKKDNEPLEITSTIQYQGNSPVIVNLTSVSVQDYILSLPEGNIEIRYEAYNTSGTRVLLDLISGEAKDWEYSSIQGVWANETFTIDSNRVDINIFENGLGGDISLDDPKLKIDLTNSIGVPMQLKIENLVAHTEDGNTIALTSIYNDGFNIEYPTLNEIGQSKTVQLLLDKNNSNIVSIFNARPISISYKIVAEVNPELTTDAGFITEDSKLVVDFGFEVPIYGTASGFTIESSSEFTMDEIEEISHASFKLITNNEIPLDLDLQLYFTDENENIIDSLFDQKRAILASPIMGANSTVINPSEQINLIDISAERFDNIQAAKQVLTSATLSTTNEGTVPVRIMSNQKVDVRMGAIIGME